MRSFRDLLVVIHMWRCLISWYRGLLSQHFGEENAQSAQLRVLDKREAVD